MVGLLVSLSCAAAAGCVSASLATDSGPLPPGAKWSDADRQAVHVGEEVAFDFVLSDSRNQLVSPTGLADYCATMVGAQRIEAEPDAYGHFAFRHRFDHVRDGDVIEVRSEAFQQFGSRDFVRVGQQWLETDSPYSVADKKVAGDSIRLTIYQSQVNMQMARPPDDLDPATGVLRFRKADGSSSAVYIDRPGRPGFVVEGPDESGLYRIRYSPSAGELNKSETTEAEWTVYDLSGRRHTVTQTLETP